MSAARSPQARKGLRTGAPAPVWVVLFFVLLLAGNCALRRGERGRPVRCWQRILSTLAVWGADAFGLCRPQHDWLRMKQLNTVFRGACDYELVFSGPSWSALDKPFWLDVGNYFLSQPLLYCHASFTCPQASFFGDVTVT